MVASAHRLALGQWFTPPAVVDLALALAEVRSGMRVLDPSCGDGAFLARAAARGPAELRGIEVDGSVAAVARANAPSAVIEHGDLFDLEPPPTLEAGYDAVVGNPPYVRQERLSAEHKLRLRARLSADWPELSARDLDRLVGRGDLAIACIARALRFARPGGRIALVVSSALLDAGYAEPLWRLVSAHGCVRAIVDAPRERWFADAAVNAVIIVIERGAAAAPAVVARLRVATAQAAVPLEDLPRVADVRHGAAASDWAVLLRAPQAWFDFRDLAGPRLVALGDLVEVRRGITSGANDVFYLPRQRAAQLGLEPDVLLPLVKRPGERIALDPDSTDHVAVVCSASALDRYPVTRAYFDRHVAASSRPTLRARRPWWALPARPARLFLAKAYDERFVQQLAPRPVIADQRVYALHPRAGVEVDLDALAAVLNSSFTALALESLGRASMGQGALEWTVTDAAALPIIDPRAIDADAARAALGALASRRVAAMRCEWHLPDRTALDNAIARDIDRRPLCEQLCETIRSRISRCRS